MSTPADQAVQHLLGLPGYSPAALAEPRWLVELIYRHLEVVLTGEGHRCEHADTAGAGVLHMAVWAPGWVVCNGCGQAGVLTKITPAWEELRCDRCRSESPHLVVSTMPYLGSLVWFALCPTCRGRTLTAAPAPVPG